MRTKDKIVLTSIEVFNELGYSNARLQIIADRLKISVGNLAYHFNTKDDIIKKVYQVVSDELKETLSSFNNEPTLKDLDNHIEKFYQFMAKYPFYFVDIVEIQRLHPELHQHRLDYIKRMIIQMKNRLEYHVNRGIIRSEEYKGHFNQLSKDISILAIFWPAYCLAIDPSNRDLCHYKSAIWAFFTPLLTQKGKEEYERSVLKIEVEN